MSMLQTASTATELSLQNFQQLMSQMIWSKDFTNAIINPSSDDYSRTTSIITRLHEVAADYGYVDKALLYIPTTNYFYSSDLLYQSVSQSSEPIFQDTASVVSFSGTRLSDSWESLWIQSASGKLYFCQHLYPEYLKSIGVLIFEINLSSWNKMLTPQQDIIGDACYVFDSEGNSLFAPEVPESIQNCADQLARESGRSPAGELAIDDARSCFYYRSGQSGWLYLYPSDRVSSLFTPQLTILLGFLMVLVSLFFTFRMASHLHRPIRSLYDEVARTNPSTENAKNEIDYLSQAYHNSDHLNQQLRQTIQTITPLALERLLANIISGHVPTPETVDATLESLGQPFAPESRYMVIALELLQKSNENLSALDESLYVLSLREHIPTCLPPAYQSYLIPRGSAQIAVILVLPPKADERELQHNISLLCQRLETLTLTKPYHVQIGCGSIYRELCDLQYSYPDAIKDLNRRKFYHTEKEKLWDDIRLEQNVYFERAHQVIGYLQRDMPGSAQKLVWQVVEEILAAAPDQEESLRQYGLFIDTLLQITEDLHIADTEGLAAQKETMFEKWDRRPPEEPLTSEIMTTLCFGILDVIEQKDRTKASQHISRVKECIHTQYSNSGLSLDMASEYAGISPSYLSRLFKQELQISFVEYLNGFRVNKAQQMLSSTDLKIKDIAFQTGFNSMQNFFRIFKKYTGTSPGDFRSNHSI